LFGDEVEVEVELLFASCTEFEAAVLLLLLLLLPAEGLLEGVGFEVAHLSLLTSAAFPSGIGQVSGFDVEAGSRWPAYQS